jgi:murein DD-endopeptidase MepM/ murein hydrolase activator NlpD
MPTQPPVRRPSGVALPEVQRGSTPTVRTVSLAAIGAVGALVLALSPLLRSDHVAPVLGIAMPEPLERPSLAVTLESVVSADDPFIRYPIPNLRGTLLTDIYASLGTPWTHPVIATERTLPLLPSGHFGAERGGVLRVVCGRGHCGADLDGPRGRPIVAVVTGTIHEIDRSRNGKDGRSGRYVRIEHDDGVITSYMHLDSIADGIEIGDRIDAGQQLGTLGATGVHSASPHLHFSIEVPKQPNARGRHAALRYVDPAPFLLRADVSDRANPARRTKRFF